MVSLPTTEVKLLTQDSVVSKCSHPGLRCVWTYAKLRMFRYSQSGFLSSFQRKFLIPKETISGRQCLCDGKEPVSKLGMFIARWLLPTHLPCLNICLLVGKKEIKHLITTRLRPNVIQWVDKHSSLQETEFKAFCLPTRADWVKVQLAGQLDLDFKQWQDSLENTRAVARRK